MCICVYVSVEATGGLILLCHSALMPWEQGLSLSMKVAYDGPVASRPQQFSLLCPSLCCTSRSVWYHIAVSILTCWTISPALTGFFCCCFVFFMYYFVHLCVGLYVPWQEQHTVEVRRPSLGIGLSFNHVGLRGWIQVIKLGRKCLYSWSQLSGPWQFFLEDKIHKDKDSGLFHFCSQQFLMFIPLDLLLKLCLFLNVLVFENVIHVYNVSWPHPLLTPSKLCFLLTWYLIVEYAHQKFYLKTKFIKEETYHI